MLVVVDKKTPTKKNGENVIKALQEIVSHGALSVPSAVLTNRG